MKHRNIFAIIIMLILCLLLASCGKPSGDGTEESSTPAFASGEELYLFYEGLVKQLPVLANEVTAAYEEASGEEYEVDLSGFDLCCIDIYSFSEEATAEFIENVFDSFYKDLTVTQTGENEYELKYTGTNPYTGDKYDGMEIIRFDLENVRMSCTFYRNEEIVSFSEAVRTGRDTYAMINNEHRLIMKCDGDTVKEFLYSENIAAIDPETGEYTDYSVINDPKDNIYSSMALDEGWVSEPGIDYGIYRFISCDGKELTVTGQTEMSDNETGEIYYVPGYRWSFAK